MAQRAPILNMPKGPLQLICDATAIKEELYFLDMRINDKKSVCIRFGNRHDVCCAPVTTCSAWRARNGQASVAYKSTGRHLEDINCITTVAKTAAVLVQLA